MAIRTVGPTSTFPTITAAMAASGPNDQIVLEAGYSNETAWVTHNGMTITGGATSTRIVLNLDTGIPSVFLAGTAPIRIRDAADGNAIVGNDGNNIITVTGGADSVNGGLGNNDRLMVDYRLATGAVTGDSTSSVSEAGGGGRLVTIVDGTIEHFTILTGSGVDTITTDAGDDIIRTGEGASTVTAGQGANTIVGGSGADTITALDGGNRVLAGDGANIVTTGGGADTITTGIGSDTIVAGGGNDFITVRGGADTVNAGAGLDELTVAYSALASNVTGGVTGGDALAGYTGRFSDGAANVVDFVETETFRILTGSGDDDITTGAYRDHISTGAGNDSIDAGSGHDFVWGGDDDDWIDGSAGNDTLYGDGGDDQLLGGLGRDVLEGGTGNDAFIFSEASETMVGSDRDRITDFTSGEDHIDLSLMATNAGVAFTFIEMAGFSNTAGEVREGTYSGNTFVAGDVDGDGAADFQIMLVAEHNLSSADFWMV